MARPRYRHRSTRPTFAVFVALLTLAGSACTASNDPEQSSATTMLSSRDSVPISTADTAPAAARAIDRRAVDASFDRLDEIVQIAMDRTGTPGIAVAVVFDDQVLYAKGFGVRNTETNEPVTPDTVFQVASMSKPISATIMAGAAGRGIIGWDDPIAKYSTRWQLSDPWVSEHVTFADLFAHRSGLPGAAAGDDLESVGYDRAVVLDRLRYLPLAPFRATYNYSNFGMTLAGAVAADAAGLNWEDLADQVLFDPAGMSSTSMRHADYVSAANRADLHVQIDGTWRPAFERDPDAQAPAGGVSSTVVDLGRWVRLVLGRGQLDGTAVIDAEQLGATLNPRILAAPLRDIAAPGSFYGLGWNIGVDETGRVRWSHSGAFETGASTLVTLLPSAGLGIIVLNNGQPIGVPEAIVDAYLRLLQHGQDDIEGLVEVWSQRFAHLYREVYPEADWSRPPADAAPSRPRSEYAGTYSNDYVGLVTIAETADGLELVIGPQARRFPLTHWSGDRWIYVPYPAVPWFRSTVDFSFSEGTQATSVRISTFDGAGLGTLVRT